MGALAPVVVSGVPTDFFRYLFSDADPIGAATSGFIRLCLCSIS